MEKLLAYLNSLTPEDRDAFAKRCETTMGYLRKACSVNQRLGEGLCLRIGTESGGAIKPEDLRPDVDWEYLRVALANTAQCATEIVAKESCPVAGLDIEHTDQERREGERREAERREAERRAQEARDAAAAGKGVA